jgi:O-methyltransferase
MKESSFSISYVSSTMLITLYARAQESISRKPIIKDPRAVEMIEIIKKEISGSDNPIHKKILRNSYNPKLAVTMALRSRRYDRYVSEFLSKYPTGTVIWYDIDFPEVMKLRRRFMEENHGISLSGSPSKIRIGLRMLKQEAHILSLRRDY